MTSIDTTGMTPEQARLARGLTDARDLEWAAAMEYGRAEMNLQAAIKNAMRAYGTSIKAKLAADTALDALTAALGRPIPWVEGE